MLREQGRNGVVDAAGEVGADTRVVGAVDQLVESTREVHVLALLAGREREPIAQVRDPSRVSQCILTMS